MTRWQDSRFPFAALPALLLPFVLAVATPGPGRAGDATDRRWPWPVPIDPPAVTGTFLEPREGRYHTGLDMRTAGRVGLPVRSPVDGWVSRVRCASTGYGRALYITTDEGLTLVFAHLEEFFDPAQEPLRRAQRRTGRYRQDLRIEAGKIPVEAGRVVALSGDTGVGAPHLHVEVRGPDERPRDPLDYFELPDSTPPRVRAVRLVPLEDDLRLDFVRVAARTPGSDHIDVPWEGGFQLFVDAEDRTSTSPFRVAPKSVEWIVDGRVRTRLVNDVIAFSQMSLSALEFERDGGRRWIDLSTDWRRDAQAAAPRRGSDRQEHRIRVTDAAGNEDTVALHFVEPVPAPPADEAFLQVQPHRVVTRCAPGSALENNGRRVGARTEDGMGWVAARGELESGVVELVDSSGTVLRHLDLFVARPRAQSVRWPERGLSLATHEDDPYAQGMLVIGRASDAPATPTVQNVGPEVWTVEAHGYGFRRPVTISTAVDDLEGLVFVRRAPGRTAWTPLTTRVSDGGTEVSAELAGPGAVALVRDTTAPTVAPRDDALQFARRDPVGPFGIRRPVHPPFVLRLVDVGVGLAADDPEVFLDGSPYAARFDPEDGELRIDWFVEPEPGKHVVEVVVRDAAGNTTRREWAVELR